jgi:hypothetical protein
MSPISPSDEAGRSAARDRAATSALSRIFLLVLWCAATVLLPGGEASSAPPAAARAVWVWESESFELLDTEARWDETFDFLARRRLDTVYLYADEYKGRNIVRDEPEKYRRLIGALHRRGCKVFALLGSWHLDTPEYILPEKRATAVRMFDAVLRYNAGSAAGERFDGVNIDIEPYLLDDWREKRALRATQYLDLAAEFMRLKRAAGDPLAVGPAMPFWFDGIEDVSWRGKRRRLSDHVQDVYDYVAIMDYRNFARGSDGMIEHARHELDYAGRTGKTVVIGVETIATEPRKVTFHGLGRAAMEEQLGIVESEFASRPSFGGFAVHHLGVYRDMPEQKSR